jgi:hypothetical protein
MRTILLSLLGLGSVNFVRGQNVSPFIGFGSAKNGMGTSTAAGCPTGQLFDGQICQAGPTMGGLFGVVGVDFMFKPHLGVDGEYSLRLHQAPYLPADGLSMRPSFYDLNILWQPVSAHRFLPLLEGGFGGAKVSLNFNQSASITGFNGSGLPTGTNPSYFQLHGAPGVKVYIHGDIFAKGQLDLHYVFHLTNQFSRNLVVQYMGSVGYTFGKR